MKTSRIIAANAENHLHATQFSSSYTFCNIAYNTYVCQDNNTKLFFPFHSWIQHVANYLVFGRDEHTHTNTHKTTDNEIVDCGRVFIVGTCLWSNGCVNSAMNALRCEQNVRCSKTSFTTWQREKKKRIASPLLLLLLLLSLGKCDG